MIEVRDLTRRYGGFAAVDGVTFTAREGEILGMLGPNGAGKTTTLRMIVGFLPPSSGEIIVAGRSLLDDGLGARREIGYLPEAVALYGEMRVGEYLRYRARLHGLGSRRARQAIGEAIERCLLAEVSGQVIGTLSKGFRQRVGLASAILHDPSVLVLDEPTVGLDPKQIIAIRELIRDLGRRRTVLLSTHILPEVELLCERVQILDRGRILAEGTPADLGERWLGRPPVRVVLARPDTETGAPSAGMVTDDNVETVAARLAALGGVTSVQEEDSLQGELCLLLQCDGDSDPRAEVFRLAVERGWLLLGLERPRASLEDVFVRLTRESPVPGEAQAAEIEETPS